MHLDPVTAAMTRPLHPEPSEPAPQRRRCGDCTGVMRPGRSLHLGRDARCTETLHHRIIGDAGWKATDEAPHWCPREVRS